MAAQSIQNFKNQIDTKVNSIMSQNVITVNGDALLIDVDNIFHENNINHLPVVDVNGICIGLLSNSDVLQLKSKFTKFNTHESEKKNERFLKSLLASEVMSHDVVALHKYSNISTAIDIFIENKVHSIVITDEEKCIGILTPIDILKYIKLTEYV